MRKYFTPFIRCVVSLVLLLEIRQDINAQINVVSGAFTPVDLIKNVFLGDGVEVTSVQFNGSPNAVGYFGNGLKDIQIDKGIVMATGNAISAATANTSSSTSGATSGTSVNDPDLVAITGGAGIFDCAQYIIKFIPNADTLRFKYVFGSEEYPEYTCSGFNDVFGFFISGPGITGPYSNNAINLALVPDPADITGLTFTNIPVAINNVHNGNPTNPACIPVFPMYYNDKIGSTTITYDGILNVFIAQVIVTPCQEYTIKLSIADKGDGVWDSVVFLEAKSFGTGAIRVTTVTTSLDGAVAENCDKGFVKLKLPEPADKDTPIDYKIFGTALNGVDYSYIAPNQIIQKGDSELVFIIEALDDNLVENTEVIGIDVQRDICNRDTFYVYIKDKLLAPPVLPQVTKICPKDSVDVDGTLPIQLPPELYFENNISLNIPDPDTPGGQGIPTFSDIIVSGVAPAMLGPGMISKVCINVQHSWIDDIDVFLVSPGGQFMELTTDNGRDGNNYTKTCFSPSATQPINYNNPFGAPAIYTPFTGSFVPEGDWSYLYQGGTNPANGKWSLLVLDDTYGLMGKLLSWDITFKPLYDLNYSWTPPNLTTCSNCPITVLNPPSTQEYILNVKDSYGCVVSDSTIVDVQQKLPAPNVLCGTTTANTIDFTWTADPNATGYLISQNGTNWVSPLPGPTNHTVYGLSLDQSVTLYVQAIGICGGFIDTVTCKTPDCVAAVVTIDSKTDAKCFGSQDGSIDLNATGLYPPFTFDNGTTNNTTGVFTNLFAGNYSVAVTDAQGCAGNFQFQINEPAELLSNPVFVDSVSCFGLSDGKASVVLQGGTYPYSYLWSNGSTGSIALNLPVGIAQVTITDNNGCKKTSSVNMAQPNMVSATFNKFNTSCFNGSNGAITANPIGGVPPFSYLWDSNAGNQVSKTAINLAAGTYFVTITDKNGCTHTDQANIQSPSSLILNTSSTNVTCFGGNDGSAMTIVSGGTTPYAYLWSDAAMQTTFKASNLTAGKYYVTVSDGGGCIEVDSVDIISPPQLNGTAQVTPTLCFGSKDGTAMINTFGGKAPYSYQWSDNGAGVSLRNDLGEGTYSVTITDSNNCTHTINNIIITSPTTASIQLASTDVLCFGGSDGTATATATGGNGGWLYKWNDPLGQDLQTASFLKAGSYIVTATDASGCTITGSIIVGEPGDIITNPVTQNVTCFGGNNGVINLNSSGGTGTLSYLWNPSNLTGQIHNNLTSGNYLVTITDANNCSKSLSFTISEPTEIKIAFDIGAVSCSGVFNGTATAIVNGGNSPYTFKWSDPNGQTTQTANGLAAGTYTVTVTDSNNCTQTGFLDISSPAAIIVDLTAIDVTCFGGNNGAVGATAQGGTTPYGFLWSNGATINVANNLTAGIYSLTVTDAMGCTVVKQTEVKQPTDIIITETIQGINCPGDKNGSVTVVVSGGLPPYNATWSSGDVGLTASNLGQGTFTLQLKDSKGCLKTGSYTIMSVDTLDIKFTVNNVSCFGYADGSISATGSGGTPGYSYSWSTGANIQNITGLAPGFYKLTITDSKACSYSEAIEVSEPTEALAATVLGNNIECFGEMTGSIYFTAQGGTPPLYYSIDGTNYYPNSVEIGLKAGSYNCFVKDKNGCVANAGTAVISEPLPFSVSLGPDITIKLRRDTQLNAVVTNGIGLINYKWIVYDTTLLSCQNCPDPKLPALFDPVLFKVIVTDQNGCSASDDVVVYVDKTRKVFVPTAFTPNGDNINDVLLTHGETDAFVKEFKIFDAWGEMVFEAKDFFLGDENIYWNGKFREKDMNVGTFVWYMEVKFVDGDVELLKGSFDLLR
jgi:gliding motility-associated-like protein